MKIHDWTWSNPVNCGLPLEGQTAFIFTSRVFMPQHVDMPKAVVVEVCDRLSSAYYFAPSTLCVEGVLRVWSSVLRKWDLAHCVDVQVKEGWSY